MLFPHLATVVIERVEQAADGSVLMWASSKAPESGCPACGHAANRVHSRYDRRLADAAIGGRAVALRLRVRRFFCDTNEYAVRTFAEQPDGVAVPRAHRTPLARGMLESISIALAGRAGSRLAGALGMPVGKNTLLRLLRALPDPEVGQVTVLGVDDWAIKRGQTYATILLDMSNHKPVDVLPDRQADTVAEWLKAHPEIQVITRDRSSAYAEAATRGAPQAVQCADRWHLFKNLAEAVEKTVVAHHACLREPTTADDAPAAGVETPSTADEAAADHEAMAERPAPGLEAESGLAARIRERFADVQALRAQGKGIRAIAREQRLDRKTARRFSLARSAEELVVKATSRASLLDEHKPYLNQRWNSGCVNISQLVREIRQRGYTGSPQTVYRYLRPFRATGRKAPGPEPAPLKIRQVTGWIMRDPDNLPGDDGQRLKAVLARCPQLQAARRHVGAFAVMIRDLRGDLLPEWIDNVLADDLPALRSFVNGLRQDWNAVLAGLTLPYSNGPTEGAVNKIKLLKRMSYGRAGFSLLRKRILHAT